MFRNYLAAALGNLLRSKLHAAINLMGLALGLATAILIGLYVRDEITFERFLPDYQDLYRLQTVDTDAQDKTTSNPSTPHDEGLSLQETFPEIAGVTRLMGGTYGVRHGNIEANERMQSADSNFFTLFGYKLLSGDAATALSAPDTIALSRAMAMKYFGTIDCVGQTLELDRKATLRVEAVYENFPSNTTLYGTNFILSGLASISSLSKADKLPPLEPGNFSTDTLTFVRLKPGAPVGAVDDGLPALVNRLYPQSRPDAAPRGGYLAPIASLHLHARELGDYRAGGDITTVYAISATGLLVLLVAGINFVNLVTARAARRALEVGVRKAAGATRQQLMTQFMTESIAYAFAALLLAVALVELVLPGFNEFLDHTIAFSYWRDPPLMVGLPVLALLIGLLAGFYPAIVLSGFRPAVVLKGAVSAQGSGTLRQVLVVLQYAISIALLIATAVIYRQTSFATQGSLGFDKNLIVAVSLGGLPGKLDADNVHFDYDPATVERLRERVSTLPGVKAAANSWVIPDADSSSYTTWHLPEHPGTGAISSAKLMLDYGFFEVYGVPVLAGRDFSRDHGGDEAPETAGVPGTAILNESAVRLFGFGTPQGAIGHEIAMDVEDNQTQPRRIIGVVPDFPLNSIRTRIAPTVFMIEPSWVEYLNIKLTGAQVPETLAAIDRIWSEMGSTRPIQRQFVDARIEHLYRDVTRQGEVFAGFALVAVLIACLGLFGLAAFTAERRTKEIGIRKAMGASTQDILKLLVWEFAKPVLLANAIAWPLAYIAMNQWLDGFAYRIQLDPLVFIGAGLVALIIACATTLYHAFQVARSRPVLALRYE